MRSLRRSPRSGFRPAGRAALIVVVAALVCSAPAARAAFHLWVIDEVFSNADGSVQFIEMFTASPFERLLAGHVLQTERALVPLMTFSALQDIGVSTQNHHLLFATPGFAAVAGIAPDYEIPRGFIQLGAADAIDWAAVDSFPLVGLPTDGVHSLNRSGLTITADLATPTNFAGMTGVIVPEPGAALGGAASLLAVAWWRRRASLQRISSAACGSASHGAGSCPK